MVMPDLNALEKISHFGGSDVLDMSVPDKGGVLASDDSKSCAANILPSKILKMFFP